MLLFAQDAVASFMQAGDVLPTIVVLGGVFVGIIAIVAAAISSVVKAREREETKREIAAYVAEGSIDPETAIAVLAAGGARDRCGTTTMPSRKSAADAVVPG